MHHVVLLRHGQSVWNQENRFTGWVDVDLSEDGVLEAKLAGKCLARHNYTFDAAFTSYLKRAIKTLWIVLDELQLDWIPLERVWQLNEQHYGILQGHNMTKSATRFGEEQVLSWHRSFDDIPPSLDKEDQRSAHFDPRYALLPPEAIPQAESLKDTYERVTEYWESSIAPCIREGKKALIVAHENSLRALVKYLDGISDEDIAEVSIPTGIPLIYELDENQKPIRHFYLRGLRA